MNISDKKEKIMAEDEKLENELNLALEMTPQEREKSLDLDAGYDKEEDRWEILFQYAGELRPEEFPEGIRVELLSQGYGIAYLSEKDLLAFADLPQIIYVEKPKNLLLEREEGIAASCMISVKAPPDDLSGEGVYVAVLDTGIDIFHPDFIDEEGNTRIAVLWDQTIPGSPPAPFQQGSIYTKEEINQALHEPDGRSLVPSTDGTGHGTHVASIAAGRRGVAPRAELIVVKLGNADGRGFPRTTQLMSALEYAIKFAQDHGRPVAVNISYGNNYGDHRGNSLLETFVTSISGSWKSTICIGTGNEGDTGRHKHGRIRQDAERILFDIAPFDPNINLQLWKHFTDDFQMELTAPSGDRHLIRRQQGKAVYRYGDTGVYVYYGEPTPYNELQEIYFAFLPEKGDSIESGQWELRLIPERIINGRYDLWLPVSSGSSAQTRFLEPSLTLTLTIPSTARKIIAAGAYNVRLNAYAGFSGRGDEEVCMEKPDLAAPGTGILGAAPGGGESVMSGTSMAAPFVSGACALMMEWGIVKGNDPYLYGEKVRACLQRGARKMNGFTEYPNSQVGYGRLCVRESLPEKGREL